MSTLLKKTTPFALAILAAASLPHAAFAQVAGSASLGVSVTELRAVAVGWSVKKQVLGKTIYNENKEKVGTVQDIIVTPERSVSYAIIGAGGFVGLGTHDVAIPVGQFRRQGQGFILPGATKEAIKALPEFTYSR